MNGLPSPPGGRGLGLRLGRTYGSERRGGNDLVITPTLILPHQRGGEFFRELDAPQLCCGVLQLRQSGIVLGLKFKWWKN